MVLFAILMAAALLSGCTALPGGSAPPTALAQVYALKSELAAADSVALAYTTLPRCGVAVSSIACSDQKKVDAIKAAENDAYSHIQAADAAVKADPQLTKPDTTTALGAASSALAGLQALNVSLYGRAGGTLK